MKTYLVGGAVRSKVLAQNTHEDRDYVVVGSTVEKMLALGFEKVGAAFPVFLHPETKEEYALARQEKKIAAGHTGFEFEFSEEITLEQDLMRRDFTVNAMALDEESAELFDPYGGQKDCQNKILRHVSEHFVEDPLRIIRAARFVAQLGFELAPETKDLIIKMVQKNLLAQLSVERIYAELLKTYLRSSRPSLFFQFLDEVGALAQLFPALARLKGVPQPVKYHPEGDAYVHTLLVIDACKELGGDEKSFIACLCHDYGKALTDPDRWPSHHHHEFLGVEPTESFCDHYKVAKEVKEFSLRFTQQHLNIHRSHTLQAKALDQLLQNLNYHRRPEWMKFFLICANADQWGKLDRRQYSQASYLQKITQSLKFFRSEIQSNWVGEEIAKQVTKQRVVYLAEQIANLA